jgi:hypothetical protein
LSSKELEAILYLLEDDAVRNLSRRSSAGTPLELLIYSSNGWSPVLMGQTIGRLSVGKPEVAVGSLYLVRLGGYSRIMEGVRRYLEKNWLFPVNAFALRTPRMTNFSSPFFADSGP